jgi:hypothetical protein
VATELIDLALRNATTVSVAEALAVLLQTWNRVYYRFHPFDERHFRAIEALVHDHSPLIGKYRQRSIASFTLNEEDAVRILYSRFQQVLGPVGAAKSLHLLAPLFFPLWDRAIAKAYHLKLDGDAATEYVRFMRLTREQCRVLTEQGAVWLDLPKALDEYNYCTYTLKSEAESE